MMREHDVGTITLDDVGPTRRAARRNNTLDVADVALVELMRSRTADTAESARSRARARIRRNSTSREVGAGGRAPRTASGAIVRRRTPSDQPVQRSAGRLDAPGRGTVRRSRAKPRIAPAIRARAPHATEVGRPGHAPAGARRRRRLAAAASTAIHSRIAIAPIARGSTPVACTRAQCTGRGARSRRRSPSSDRRGRERVAGDAGTRSARQAHSADRLSRLPRIPSDAEAARSPATRPDRAASSRRDVRSLVGRVGFEPT